MPKTRTETFSHLSNFLGRGKELHPSELPTLRDVLRYGLLLREECNIDGKNYPTSVLAKDIYHKVIEKWQHANSSFQSPVLVSRVTIVERIKDSWEQARNISLGRGNLSSKQSFICKLDKLFDILTCKCDIVQCDDYSCTESCTKQAHVKCTCRKEIRFSNELQGA